MRGKFTKLTSAFLAVIMIFGIFTIIPFTANAATSGDFEYEVLEDGTAEITAYNGSAKALTIPYKLDGYTVTKIGYRSFYKNTSLTSLIIPDSVKSIGNMAFWSCNLTSVNLGNGVTIIGKQAFAGNKSLTNVTFGNSLTSIDDNALLMCTSLTDITIPDGVTSIGLNAFKGCEKLQSVTIPDSVTKVGGSAFLNTKLYTNQPDSVYYVDGWLCGYNGEIPENTSIEIKEGTRGLADRALYYNANLISVTIPDSVKYIGEAEFNKCTNLTSVTIGNGVTSISAQTFEECTSLTDVTIGNSVTNIGASAFYNCSALTSLTIPDSVTEIGDKAFSLCTSLESMTIPASVTYIESSAFNNPSDALTIYGYTGSAAETFANEKGINFISLGGDITKLLGDVNSDGKISIDDVTDIQKYVANMLSFTEEQKLLADVDKDGKISIDDVTLIQKHLAGLEVIE